MNPRLRVMVVGGRRVAGLGVGVDIGRMCHWIVRRWRGRAVLAISVASVIARSSMSAQPGVGATSNYDYTFIVERRTEITGRPVTDEPRFEARVRTQGPVARVDVLAGAGGPTTPGNWYLTRDLGRTMTVVDVRDQQYREMGVVAERERLIAEKGLQASVSNLSIDVRPPRACGDIDGWKTLCVTVYRRYTAHTRYWVMSTRAEVVEETRLWLAPELQALQVPFGSFFDTRTELLVRRDSVYIAREREAGLVMQAGGLLRMEVARTETAGKTRTRTLRRIGVSGVRRTRSDERLFEVPPGFRLVRR